MKNDSRCVCGSRYFEAGDVMITCTYGDAYEHGSICVARCLLCGEGYLYGLRKTGPKSMVSLKDPLAKEILEAATAIDFRNRQEPESPPYPYVDAEDRLDAPAEVKSKWPHDWKPTPKPKRKGPRA